MLYLIILMLQVSPWGINRNLPDGTWRDCFQSGKNEKKNCIENYNTEIFKVKFLDPNKKVAIAHEDPGVALVPPVWPL